MDSEDWRKCVSGLQDLMTDEQILTWIEPIQPYAADGVLTLFCPNQHVVEVVRERYLSSIEEALPKRFDRIALCVGEVPKRTGDQADLPLPLKRQPAPGPKRPAASKQLTQSAPGKSSKDGYLPSYWSETQRGLSNYLTRSALFTANSYGATTERPYHRNYKVRSPTNVELYFTGEELNQFDQEVHMQLLHYQRKLPVGEQIHFSLSQLCADMGLSKSGRNTARLREALDRLRNAAIVLKGLSDGETIRFSDSLISNFVEKTSEVSSRWVVRFSKEILSVMSYESITFINLEIDRRLSSELSKYMHRFLSTHRNPLPYKLETYYELSGSRIATLNNFRKKMRLALQELEDVGFLDYWTIDDHDKVHVVRSTKKSLEAKRSDTA